MKTTLTVISLFSATLLSAGSFSFSAQALPEAGGCVTAQCHPSIVKAKNVHPSRSPATPAIRQQRRPIPRKKQTFKLVQALPGLCSQCHPPFGTMKYVHAPVKNGACTACHNPHASDEPKLLVRPTKDLCGACHADKTKHAYVHGPTATGDCTACHNPHESGEKALLVKDSPDLCFICHVDMQGEMKKGGALGHRERVHILPQPHGSAAKNCSPRRVQSSVSSVILRSRTGSRKPRSSIRRSEREGVRLMPCAPRE